MIVQHLLVRARNGDKFAEEEMLEYLRARFNYLAKQRIEGGDAEDVAQDACITVLEKYKEVLPEIEFEAWAYQVLRNKIGNYFRKRDVRRRAMRDTGLSEQVPEVMSAEPDADLWYRLRICLRKLILAYPRYARVLNLIHQGYTTDEISARLRISRNNLYTILSRGRAMLSDCIFNGEKLS